MSLDLRPYQAQAVKLIRTFLREDPDQKLVVMATGTGKTYVIAAATHAARRMFGGTGRVLIIAHRREIIQQIAAVVRRTVSAPVGIESGDEEADPGSEVVIASVQKMRSREGLSWFEPDLVIVDEGHHAVAASYSDAIRRLSRGRDLHVLGFTATPHRMKGTALAGGDGSPFSGSLFEYPIRQAVDDGWLCDVRGFQVKSTVNLDGLRIVHGDFNGKDLQRAVDVDARTAMAFKARQRVGAGRPTIAFCAGAAHAKDVARFAAEIGLRAEVVLGDTPVAERDRVLRAYRSGCLDVIANCEVLTEGFDAPETSCLMMLRPTRSWGLYVQMLGRGMRPSERKTDLVVLDVVDVTRRHAVMTLPGVVGLPPRTDVEGATLADIYDAADALGQIPEAARMFEGTLDELPVYLRRIQVLQEKPAEPESRGRWLTAFGEKKRVYEWLKDRRCVVSPMVLSWRLSQGMPAETAMTTQGREKNRLFPAFGEAKTIADWAKDPRCLVSWRALQARLDRGIPMEEAMIAPAKDMRPDISGEQYGHLTVIEMSGKKGGSTLWRCRCDCGKERMETLARLRHPRGPRSCGCRRHSRLDT